MDTEFTIRYLAYNFKLNSTCEMWHIIKHGIQQYIFDLEVNMEFDVGCLTYN